MHYNFKSNIYCIYIYIYKKNSNLTVFVSILIVAQDTPQKWTPNMYISYKGNIVRHFE